MPKDVIERAIKKGTGELEGVEYIEIRYEGYDLMELLLQQMQLQTYNRFVGSVRSNFSKKLEIQVLMDLYHIC